MVKRPKPYKPGPTGEFPRGRIAAQDDGELLIEFGLGPGGQIIVEFGTSVQWIGLSPDDARGMANRLLRIADIAEQ